MVHRFGETAVNVIMRQ